MTPKTATQARRVSGVPPIRLGINIDHIATLRNARGGRHPDPVRAAKLAVEAGADNITAHLREDRRHIRDDEIALAARPHACCLVPERRQELTTEGGLDVAGQVGTLTPFIAELRRADIQVSLFIDPDPEQIAASRKVETDAVEFHTGTYCAAAGAGDGPAVERELRRLIDGAAAAAASGLEVHAGHGLDYDNVAAVASIPEIVELNIGHYLVGEALFVGLSSSVARMRSVMDGARETLRHSATEAKVGG